ncbi:hypothetical protein [Nannocystis punicea]|uniref:Uncharacterized protein n=1 Tax=Nannocystis punicea TaxID=2995304 RepID=A0ABY7H7X6_9BACT|nr:hypothetical protein [Nannocystis poenicansa]WAS95361.1 hypothetical protein O0S08_04305 [Nannocystis poenicansa]
MALAREPGPPLVGDAERQGVDPPREPDVVAPPLPAGPAPSTRPPAPLLGLTLVALPLFVAGLAMTFSGAMRYRLHRDGPDCASYGVECAEAITPRIHVAAAGTGLLGAGFGVAAAGITGTRARGSTAWWVELGIGGGLVVGGSAWLIGNSVLLHRQLETGPLADIDARNLRRPFASFMLGAGLGLVGGSLTALLVRRKHARALQVAPYGGPGQAGLSLSGRF